MSAVMTTNVINVTPSRHDKPDRPFSRILPTLCAVDGDFYWLKVEFRGSVQATYGKPYH
jgi:hypothetical protein